MDNSDTYFNFVLGFILAIRHIEKIILCSMIQVRKRNL